MREWSIDDEKVKLFEERCLKPFFPSAKPAMISAMGSAETKKFKHVNMEFGGAFDNFIGSPYHYRGTYKFLHYTSLKALFGILKEGKLRMYNLRGMDDPKEISYAIENLGITFRDDTEREWKTDGYYGLSMTDPIIEKRKKSLDVWRNYGNDGYGVAIELTFIKRDAARWHGFALSKTFYGKRGFKHIRDFHESYAGFVTETGFSISNFDDLFSPIRAFHKTEGYFSEKEYRLIYNLHGLSVNSEKMLLDRMRTHSDIHPDVNAKNQPTNYFELHLNYGRKSFINILDVSPLEPKCVYPSVNIGKIIFGYRLSQNQKIDICDAIREQYSNIYPDIEFEDSTLTQDFHS